MAGEPDASVVGRGRRGLLTTLVDQHNDRLDPAPVERAGLLVDGLHLVGKTHAGDTGRVDQAGRALERQADEADRHATDHAHGRAGQQQLVVGALEDVCGQIGVVGAGIRRRREVAAVDRVTPAVLHAQQFRGSLVELVVADAGHIQPENVEGLDAGFVMEHPGQERGTTDRVARGDRQRIHVAHLGAQLGELRGEILHAARGGGRGVAGERAVGRLEMAVVVVEGEQLHRDRPGRLSTRRGGAGGAGQARGDRRDRTGREHQSGLAHSNLLYGRLACAGHREGTYLSKPTGTRPRA